MNAARVMLPVRRLRYEVRCILAKWPSLYLPLASLKRSDVDGPTAVNRQTDLVIEAFPRSGNTFAYRAFCLSQPRPMRVAHHLHAPAQIIAAHKLGIPALLIVRDPLDASASFIIREKVVTPRQALKAWLQFHRPLIPFANAIAIASFEQIVSDFGAVVRKINDKFGTRFVPFVHTPDHVARCMQAIEERNTRLFGHGRIEETMISRPSSAREARKAGVIRELEIHEDLLGAARELFSWFERRTQ